MGIRSDAELTLVVCDSSERSIAKQKGEREYLRGGKKKKRPHIRHGIAGCVEKRRIRRLGQTLEHNPPFGWTIVTSDITHSGLQARFSLSPSTGCRRAQRPSYPSETTLSFLFVFSGPSQWLRHSHFLRWRSDCCG